MSPLVVSDVSIEGCTDFITKAALVARECWAVFGLYMADNVDLINGLKSTAKAQAYKSVLNRIFVDEGLYSFLPL